MPEKQKTIAYIGTYTSTGSKGIAICGYDPARGSLRQTGECEIENPSYLIVSHDRRFLYAVIESRSYMGQNGGGVAAYRIDQSTGALSFLNACPTFGKDPCHLCVDRANTRLAVANYSEGTISCYALAPDGSIIPPAAVTRHEGSGPNPVRQEMAHVHFVGFTPDEELLYAVDLGLDTVRFYRQALQGGRFCLTPDETALAFAPGSGPRHLVLGGSGFVYAVTELKSQVSVFKLQKGGRAEPLQTLTTLPDGYTGENIAAALRLSPDGRFIYASNRGHDSIAAFRVTGSGLLEAAGHFQSGGVFPRDIALAPGGETLFAANQESDTVAAFAVDRQTGSLAPTDGGIRLPKPVCITFLTL